jgi:hypothetical protein
LSNAIGNLELKNEYAQALRKLGQDLELVADQASALNPNPSKIVSSSYVSKFLNKVGIRAILFVQWDISVWSWFPMISYWLFFIKNKNILSTYGACLEVVLVH